MDARSEAGSRLTAMGTQLLEAHIWLREMLEDLQDSVDDYFDGKGLPPRDLRAHCLSFCTALTRHHTGEDRGAFPAIAEEFPELRKVLSDLRTDHNQLDWLLGEPPEPARVPPGEAGPRHGRQGARGGGRAVGGHADALHLRGEEADLRPQLDGRARVAREPARFPADRRRGRVSDFFPVRSHARNGDGSTAPA